MVTVRLRYLHGFVDKTGRVRYYFRYRGTRWPLPGQPGTSEFTATYDALLKKCLPTKRGSNVYFAPATMGYVIGKYRASDKLAKRARSTRRSYGQLLDRLQDLCGAALIADLRERHVRALRKEFKAPSASDRAVMMVRLLWQFAKEDLDIELGPNPAAEVERKHSREWSHEPWPDEFIVKFLAEARPRPNAQRAVMLLLHTGQRVGDVATMQWEQYDGRWLRVRQAKTGKLLQIPCSEALKEMLDSMERKSPFILTTLRGGGYSPGALSNMIHDATARLGAGEHTAHGLRANAAVRLAHAGCTFHMIMAITGHATAREILRYTKGVDQAKLALEAVERLEVANLRTKGKQNSG
jgi:integrase